MAGESWQPQDPVNGAAEPVTEPSPAMLGELAAQPTRFTLFAALRALEAAHADKPRLGESRRVSDDAVRLGQPPHLFFAPCDVMSYETESGERPRLRQFCFGIMGPNGALPIHLTEYAQERENQHADPTLADFINAFQHRMISLFYRAWASADPAANLDRRPSDRFTGYAGALIGMSSEAFRKRDDVIDYAKLSRCGQFAPQARSAEGLESILGDYFELPVKIEPFIGAWLQIPEETYCRLGGERDCALLGAGATLGKASWQCQHRFEIVVGPLSGAEFTDLLPGSRALRELRALVRFYTNDEWAWQIRLLLRDVDVPGVALGRQGRLAWTTWLGGRRETADDVVLNGDESWLA
jgi:type VI secretion system protein ImpH